MRLFIAINFSADVKRSVYRNVEILRKNAVSGTFTREENIHLTLAFLGETPPKRVPDIRGVMDAVSLYPFDTRLSGIGKFRNRGETLFWQGFKPADALSDLQRQLVSGLEKAQIEFDAKPFKPHVTLARRCVMDDDFSEDDLIKSISDVPLLISDISLMRSERIGGRLQYIEMYKKDL